MAVLDKKVIMFKNEENEDASFDDCN